MDNDLSIFLVSFISKMLYFFITYFLSRILSKSTYNESLSPYEGFFLCAIPIFSISIILTIVSICLSVPLSRKLSFMIVISAFLLLFINILIFGLYEYIQQKNMELASIRLKGQRDSDSVKYYKMLMREDEKQKLLIHDIKKHLHTISALIDQKNYDKISSYLEHVLDSSELKHSVRVCDNDLLNAIICRYVKICNENNIILDLDIRSKCLDFLYDDDLSILLGNLMDNATEASAISTNPCIILNIFKKDDAEQSVLTLVNTCQKSPLDIKGDLILTSKSDSHFHGLGMRSIKNIVNKYNGEMTFYYDSSNNTFHQIILLQNNQ